MSVKKTVLRVAAVFLTIVAVLGASTATASAHPCRNNRNPNVCLW